MKHDSSNFLIDSGMPGKPISQGPSEKAEKLFLQKKGLQQTAWEDLQITNDFLFGKVMQDPELCKGLLQRILPELAIDHIEYPELQKSLQPDHDAKSIRLDVYVQDDKDTVYNIEMQVKTTNDIPKRSRYYQSIIDLQWLDRGETNYKNLNKTYIIFICLSDLYQKGRHIYTFENICREDHSIIMGDEAVKIILNAKGTLDDVSGELKAFLDYAAGKKAEDIFVEKLDQALKKAKKNRKWRVPDIQGMSVWHGPERRGERVYDIANEISGNLGRGP